MRRILRKIYMNVNGLIGYTSNDRGAYRSMLGVAGYLMIILFGSYFLICNNLPLLFHYEVKHKDLIFTSVYFIVGIIVLWLIYDLYIKGNYKLLLRDEKYNNKRTHIHAIIMFVSGLAFFCINVFFLYIQNKYL